ncbi:MAG: hypothetical protein C4K49_04770 [Candidatus Thorarchaeota archaeon]|nr:MAG: hypothetical protein C4K49_04770 [Candidatus Thorarchaeota archaeon]
MRGCVYICSNNLVIAVSQRTPTSPLAPKEPKRMGNTARMSRTVIGMEVPPEFKHLLGPSTPSWDSIISAADRRTSKGSTPFAAFTDTAIEAARKESMKSDPKNEIIILGLEACLTRGRFPEALFLSSETQSVPVLSLRAIALFVLSDVEGLRAIVKLMTTLVDLRSPASDLVRVSTVRVLEAAAARDASVITCAMEFDSLLESHPEQVEEPLTETMFTLYVVGTLLRDVGQPARASRIADTLEGMAKSRNHRMFLALVENLRGNISNFQGDYVDAEKHYLRVREISDELSFNLGLGMALNNLGTLKLNCLRLEEALQYFEAALQRMDMDSAKVVTLSNLGEITTILGRYDEAEKHLRQAVRLEEKSHGGPIEAYTWLSVMLSRTGRLKEANGVLQEASRIAQASEKPLQKCAFLHASGIYHAARHEFDEAITAFEEVLNIARKNTILEMLVRAELELAKAHLEAYRTYQDSQKLVDATYHLGNLIQIAQEQELQSLHGEAILLRSDVLMLAGRASEATGELRRAASIATLAGDTRLEKEVKTRLDSVLASTARAGSGLQPEIAKSLDRLSGFKPAGRVKEIARPVLHAVIALNRYSGIPEYAHYFDLRFEMDSTLVSGFLSAINTFARSLMGDRGLLRSIDHEGFTIMVEHTASRIVTLIVDRESLDMRYRLREFARRLEGSFPSAATGVGSLSEDHQAADGLAEDVFGEGIPPAD